MPHSDSFIGFPEETTGVYIPNQRWKAGGDSASESLGMTSNFSVIYEFIRERMRSSGVPSAVAAAGRTESVPGAHTAPALAEAYTAMYR